MKSLTRFKHICKKAALTALAGLISIPALAGWTVSGTQVLDPNGSEFVFRGVNHAHTWFTSQTSQALKDIAGTGANSVRVVLSNGTQWTRNDGSDVASVISQCKANKLVCVLEVHDSTGYGEAGAATHISKAVEYWLSSDVKSAIVGQEDYVIINIANEPFGNSTSASTYVSDTSSAIKSLRSGGLTHMLMVDAANWGQDWSGAMRDGASTIFSADSRKNTIFSVHMYEVYNSGSIIQQYLSSFASKGLAIVVGEFGADHGGKFVDAASILQYAQDMGIGYMGWSWSGNGSCCYSLDIVNNWNPSSLSTWGDFLINSTNGIKKTSKLATNFSGGSNSSASSSSSSRSSSSVSSSQQSSSTGGTSGSQCNWYGTTTPLCVNTSTGWGWENNLSCVGRTDCAGQPSPYGIIGGTSSVSSSSSSRSSSSSSAAQSSSTNNTSGSQCNWGGNIFPICTSTSSGWGWENNASCIARTDCAGQSSPYGVIGGSSSVASSSSSRSSSSSTSKWESLIDGNSFSNYSTFEKHWNYLYPWGSDHNGTARMYGSSANHKQIYLENGNVLVLKATPVSATEGKSKADPYLTIKYHSGAIHAKTQVLVNDQYPNWEVRGEFQAPTSKGTWPAFWLTGAWTWPPELDILEFKGNATNWFNTFRTSSDVTTTKVSVSSPNNWHKYRAWITKVNSTDVDVHYYIDETWYAVHRATGFVGKPMWVIINLQMEGSAGAPGPTSDTYYRARNVYIGRTSTH